VWTGQDKSSVHVFCTKGQKGCDSAGKYDEDIGLSFLLQRMAFALERVNVFACVCVSDESVSVERTVRCKRVPR
jgi:hypothetical protein